MNRSLRSSVKFTPVKAPAVNAVKSGEIQQEKDSDDYSNYSDD